MDEKCIPGGADEIQRRIEAAAAGGKVALAAGQYALSRSVSIDVPCLCLEGESWCYSADPNGVFESYFGTKLRLSGEFPAVMVGEKALARGCEITRIGVQGNLLGMDTRPLFSGGGPSASCGVCFRHTRIDQGEFSKLSFCGLAAGVRADGLAELDACVFERCNFDGCANGVWFAPRASYYTLFRQCVMADHPFYAIYADGTSGNIHNLRIVENTFVRDGGAFSDNSAFPPAAVCLKNIHDSQVQNNLFDNPGTFWYYPPDAKKNDERQISRRSTCALLVYGNNNRIVGNTFLNSSGASIHVIGNGNIIMNNICDANILVEGEGNQLIGNAFTRPDARAVIR